MTFHNFSPKPSESEYQQSTKPVRNNELVEDKHWTKNFNTEFIDEKLILFSEEFMTHINSKKDKKIIIITIEFNVYVLHIQIYGCVK